MKKNSHPTAHPAVQRQKLPMLGGKGLYALAMAAVALTTAATKATAQSIVSAPLSPVPVPTNDIWALGAAVLAIAVVGAYGLRGQRRRVGWPLLLAGLAITGALWNGPTPWALVLTQFTQPGGQTLPIPVVPITNNGNLQGFEAADFQNATGQPIRIAALTPPGFGACFSVFPAVPLPPPVGGAGPAACAVGTALAVGASCRVDVDAICKALATQATAVIAVAPTSLVFAPNGSASVTVTADAASPQAAQNVAATIPGGSALTVQSSTCGAVLAPGASCTITFTSAVATGPVAVAIGGGNTAAASLQVTVAPNPTLTISGPAQASRIITVGSATALALTVTNNAGSAFNATNITVTNKTAAPNVVVDASNCASLAPGASCTLQLTSSTAYAPATLTVAGDNTSNTPTTLVAFAHLGGLVYEVSGAVGKVVVDAAQQFTSQWTGSNFSSGASSTTDGKANTDAIVANPSCFNSPGSCAAQRCRNIDADWYLPALDEMSAVRAALCPSGVGCNFSSFTGTHHTSTETSPVTMRTVGMPAGTIGATGKSSPFANRCVRAFTP